VVAQPPSALNCIYSPLVTCQPAIWKGFHKPAMSRSIAVEHEGMAFMAALDDVAVNCNDTSGNADLSRANAILKPAYAAAISLVALIGSLSTLHSALKFSSRGLQ
jgi:hypothetical protein